MAQTEKRTWQLYERPGTEGRVGQNYFNAVRLTLRRSLAKPHIEFGVE